MFFIYLPHDLFNFIKVFNIIVENKSTAYISNGLNKDLVKHFTLKCMKVYRIILTGSEVNDRTRKDLFKL